jgi:hypothetical protein
MLDATSDGTQSVNGPRKPGNVPKSGRGPVPAKYLAHLHRRYSCVIRVFKSFEAHDLLSMTGRRVAPSSFT